MSGKVKIQVKISPSASRSQHGNLVHLLTCSKDSGKKTVTVDIKRKSAVDLSYENFKEATSQTFLSGAAAAARERVDTASGPILRSGHFGTQKYVDWQTLPSKAWPLEVPTVLENACDPMLRSVFLEEEGTGADSDRGEDSPGYAGDSNNNHDSASSHMDYSFELPTGDLDLIETVLTPHCRAQDSEENSNDSDCGQGEQETSLNADYRILASVDFLL